MYVVRDELAFGQTLSWLPYSYSYSYILDLHNIVLLPQLCSVDDKVPSLSPSLLSVMLRAGSKHRPSSLRNVFRCQPHSRSIRRHDYASVTELSSYPKPGEQLHGFTLQRAHHVPELQLTALQLQHDKTGAEYLHIARDDRNNVFSIGFKTNPPDATGLPHILEHTTLCGSEKYVVCVE